MPIRMGFGVGFAPDWSWGDYLHYYLMTKRIRRHIKDAREVIYAATLVVKFGLTVEDLKDSLAPYLTMAEGLRLTVLTFDKDVSKLSCCSG